MSTHHLSRVARDLAVEQALDAAIEIDEVMAGYRSDAPALAELVSNLLGSRGEAPHADKNDLLSDSQFTSLYQRAARAPDHKNKSALESNVLELLLNLNSVGLSRLKRDQLAAVRDFCLGLNRELVAEAFSRTPEPPLSRSRHQKFARADGY
jgi:hypothetical protein